MFFDHVNQLRNADGFCKKWMSLDTETALCFGSGDQRTEKYDRSPLQFRVGLDLRCYIAAVHLWHHYVEQNQIWLEALRSLVGFGGNVLFKHKITARFFEKNFNQVSAIRVVIDDQNSS